jgi:hypothetical protein
MLGVWVVSLLTATVIWSACYPQLHQYMEEYPAMAEAREGLEKFRALVASTSPLSEDQARALTATLIAESKRRHVEDDMFPDYLWNDRRGQLQFEEDAVIAREQSNRRILESAQSYLDARQLAVLRESMAQRIERALTRLQARRDDLERDFR